MLGAFVLSHTAIQTVVDELPTRRQVVRQGQLRDLILTRVGHRHLHLEVGASGQVGQVDRVAILVGIAHRHVDEVAALVHVVFGHSSLGEDMGHHLLVGVVLDFDGVAAQFRREAESDGGHIGIQGTFLAVHLDGGREVAIVEAHLLGILAKHEEREGRSLGVEPIVAAQHAAHRVDVVLHRLLVHVAEHLHVGQEGEVAGAGAEGGVIVRHHLSFFHIGQQALGDAGLTRLGKGSGCQGFGEVILHRNFLEAVHGAHLSLVGQSQHKETVGLYGLTLLVVGVVAPLLGTVALVFQ